MSLAPDPILLDISPAGVAVLSLNRPAQNNALDLFAIEALADAVETLRGAEHVRIVFLRGAHGNFSAGEDLDWLRELSARPHGDAEAAGLIALKALKALHDLPQFVVALVEGHAHGLGLGLIAAADWTVMAANAHLRAPDVRHGFAPALIAPFLVEALGARAARGLLASAAPLDANAALHCGLAQELAADEAALEGALKRLSGLALENAPGAVAETKTLTRAPKLLDDSVLRDAAKHFGASLTSDEARKGLAALKEQRPPEWDS